MTAPAAPVDPTAHADDSAIDGPQVDTWVKQIMGMPISIRIRAMNPDRPDITAAVIETWSLLREVDNVFSTWRTDSDLMQVRRGLLPPSLAHPWIDDVRTLCAYAEASTGGLFTSDLPTADGTYAWDPIGLVKGWAVDRAADVLRRLDSVAFTINAGGDVVCGLGRNSQSLATPWRVGIEDPHDADAVLDVVEIVEGALATSGLSARGCHIIDPRTARPARSIVQTSVQGPLLVWADVWATACFIDPDARPPKGYRQLSVVRR